MTQGEVHFDRTATVSITIRGFSGANDKTIVAVIDTGFDRFLSLPMEWVTGLRLAFLGRGESVLFGGSVAEFDIYAAIVEIAGEERGIIVFAAENPPLIGMSLLYGLKLTVEVVDGGMVVIEPLPFEPIVETT